MVWRTRHWFDFVFLWIDGMFTQRLPIVIATPTYPSQTYLPLIQVGSSIIAAWSDISSTLNAVSSDLDVLDPITGAEVPLPGAKGMIGSLNAGYIWMMMNCFFSAAYVSRPFRAFFFVVYEVR